MAKVVILSGAGISAESGLSTFRSEDGLWEGHEVTQVSTKEALANNRSAVIKFYDQRRIELEDKQPNHAHQVIAQLKHKYPKDIAVITQNIDDLFEKAGLSADEVMHLHGFAREVRCPHCDHIEDIGYKALGYSRFNGKCSKCSYDKLRPNVVLFHEPAPRYKDLDRELADCELFVVIGTQGSVVSVNGTARRVFHSILNNLEANDFIDHDFFDEVYFEPATTAIDKIAKTIKYFLEPVALGSYSFRSALEDFFSVPSPLRSTDGLLVAPKKVLEEIRQYNKQVYEDAMNKYGISDKHEALSKEMDERNKKLKISKSAEIFIHKLNALLRNEYVEICTIDNPALAFFDEEEAGIKWTRVLCVCVMIVNKRPMLQTSSGDIDLLMVNDIRLPYQPMTITQVLQKAEPLAEDAFDYQEVAEAVLKHLSDRVWAKQILATAIEKSETSYELISLSKSILTLLNDKALAVQALEKAYATKKEDMDDFRALLKVAKGLGKLVPNFAVWLAEYESACQDIDDHLALLELQDYGRLKVLNQALDSAKTIWDCLGVLENITSSR